MHKSFTLGSLLLALACFVSSTLMDPTAALGVTKKKGAAKASSGSSAREKKLLAWTTPYPTAYDVKRPDFSLRGTVTDFKQAKGEYEIHVLPLEVLKNPHHYITLEHYKKGITLRVPLSKGELKNLRKGGMVEYDQHSKEIGGKAMGHAKLISEQEYTEFKPSDVAPVAYLTKKGMEPEQLENALTGALLYQGPIEKTEELKKSLDTLSKHSDAKVSQKAKALSAKLFTGK